MIGRLRGILLVKKPPSLLIDVHGVGYEVDAPMSTFYTLPEVGQETILLTHLAVREDAQQLYGFASEPERSLFRQLIKVSGVGAKMAITILSGASVDEFARAIRDSDTARLVRLPGIGKKTAERLVVEMRDKLSVHSSDATPLSFVHDGPSAQPTDAVSDAVSALVALGYKPQEASRWMGSINAEGLSSEELIRQALRLAAK